DRTFPPAPEPARPRGAGPKNKTPLTLGFSVFYNDIFLPIFNIWAYRARVAIRERFFLILSKIMLII
ncbi:hypothetical protein ACVGWK_00355, partial [Enterobacter sichuanensis]